MLLQFAHCHLLTPHLRPNHSRTYKESPSLHREVLRRIPTPPHPTMPTTTSLNAPLHLNTCRDGDPPPPPHLPGQLCASFFFPNVQSLLTQLQTIAPHSIKEFISVACEDLDGEKKSSSSRNPNNAMLWGAEGTHWALQWSSLNQTLAQHGNRAPALERHQCTTHGAEQPETHFTNSSKAHSTRRH